MDSEARPTDQSESSRSASQNLGSDRAREPTRHRKRSPPTGGWASYRSSLSDLKARGPIRLRSGPRDTCSQTRGRAAFRPGEGWNRGRALSSDSSAWRPPSRIRVGRMRFCRPTATLRDSSIARSPLTSRRSPPNSTRRRTAPNWVSGAASPANSSLARPRPPPSSRTFSPPDPSPSAEAAPRGALCLPSRAWARRSWCTPRRAGAPSRRRPAQYSRSARCSAAPSTSRAPCYGAET